MRFRNHRWQRECYEFLEKPSDLKYFAQGVLRPAGWVALPARFHVSRSDVGGVRMGDKFVQLGPRERQIASLLLLGCDNSEIARQMKIARRTVKAHFNRLFLRL